MAITTLAMVATVFVGNLYERKDKPVPDWAKTLLMKYVAKILCMCDCGPEPINTDPDCILDGNERNGNGKKSDRKIEKFRLVTLLNPTNAGRKQHRSHGSGLYNSCDTENRSKSCDRRTGCDGRLRKGSLPSASVSASSSGLLGPLLHRRPSDTPSAVVPQQPPPPEKSNYAKDWGHVAAVCDRFFFWLCLLFIVATTMLLFHPLTTSRYFKIPVIDSKVNM